MFRKWFKLRTTPLVFQLVFGLGSVFLSTSAWGVGVQLQNDMTYHFSRSTNKPGQVAANWFHRDIGFSTRLRFEWVLMERYDRRMEFLIGPYFRGSVISFLTGYGSDIRGFSAFEPGLDIGINWFGWVRTLVSGSPFWIMGYSTTDITGDPNFTTRFNAEHFSVGARIEVPILVLHSDPGDQRFEIGALVSYQWDQITSYQVVPENFDGGGNPTFNRVSDTQEMGYRILFGAFINVRF